MSLAIGLARGLGGLAQGMAQKREQDRIMEERAQMRAAAELKDRLDRERQAKLDAQNAEQMNLNNRLRLATQAREMTAAGFSPYQPGMVDAPTAAAADGVASLGSAPSPMAGMFGAAAGVLDAVNAQRSPALAEAQGGFLKTGMSEQERIRQDERESRVAQQRAQLAQAAELTRERIAAENARAQETNATRQMIAGMAAAGRQQPPATARTLPQGVESAIAENATVLNSIDMAEQSLAAGGGKTAFGRAQGIKRSLGLERMGISPEDQELAAIVGNVASQQIKLRSGAAVTASEWPRLRPFIPVLDGPGADDAATVRRKLAKMRQIIAEETNTRADYYEGQGYAVPAIPGRQARTPNARRDRPAPAPLDDPGFIDFLRSRGYAP